MQRIIKYSLLILLLVFSATARAAVTANSVVTAQTPNLPKLQFTNASTPGTYATAYTGGSNGSKIVGLYVSQNDSTATHVVTCGRFNGGTQYESYTVTTVSPAAGSYSVLDMLGTWPGLPRDSDGNAYIYLASASDTIQCTFATTITSGKLLNIGGAAADF